MTRILVVDDERSIREFVTFALEFEGYEVFEARNGREALALLEAGERPDLLLVDVMMPEMDGIALVRRMRADAALATLPVVMMSAGLNLDLPRAEISAFLAKPFDLEDLVAVVRASGNHHEPPQ